MNSVRTMAKHDAARVAKKAAYEAVKTAAWDEYDAALDVAMAKQAALDVARAEYEAAVAVFNTYDASKGADRKAAKEAAEAAMAEYMAACEAVRAEYNAAMKAESKR